jgi:GntR family transcriptional regulator of vanillate catabolism
MWHATPDPHAPIAAIPSTKLFIMSQQDQIVLKLREMILNGELAPGQRLLEVDLANRLDVSRTPVRRAIKILESEGLLASNGARGYHVRLFSFRDMVNAIEVRGALEGLAARTVAMRGLSPSAQRQLEHCLEEGDRLIQKGALCHGDEEIFATMNVAFHHAIIETANIKALSNAISVNNRLPFAAAGAVALDMDTPDIKAQQFRLIHGAHTQHHAIYQALTQRQGARVEALMREHVYLAVENMKLLMESRTDKVKPVSSVNGDD